MAVQPLRTRRRTFPFTEKKAQDQQTEGPNQYVDCQIQKQHPKRPQHYPCTFAMHALGIYEANEKGARHGERFDELVLGLAKWR